MLSYSQIAAFTPPTGPLAGPDVATVRNRLYQNRQVCSHLAGFYFPLLLRCNAPSVPAKNDMSTPDKI